MHDRRTILSNKRPSNLAMGLLLLLLGLFVVSLGISGWNGAQDRAEAADQQLVRQLGLTDLALFTEARYTRHLSLADSHSPFQDHPSALDHFPSASLIPPPQQLHYPHAKNP